LSISSKWDDDTKSLILTPSNKIGLVPVRNPYGGKVYGSLVVKPRLGWIDIYKILETIDWKYQPNFLKEEEPIFSNGILPRWFKAIDTLEAIAQALNMLIRGMDSKYVELNVPIGNVDWNSYSTKNIPYGKYAQFNSVITDYSIDLEIHRQFKGITKMISQDISSGNVPIKVKYRAKQLITNIERKLENVSLELPNIQKLKKVKIPGFYRNLYEKAIKKCEEYINQSRFSISGGNYYGLPWYIEMDRLFEFWVEHWAHIFAKRIGARFYSDFRKSSKIRFYNINNWKSLSQLKPDIIIEKESKTLIIEVKYKKHLAYLQFGNCPSEIFEEHRQDIHQLLSYMSCSSNDKRIGCLLYPTFDENIPNQFATLINYTNTKVNVDVVLCGTPFQPEKFLTLLENLWGEKNVFA
jgi:5-methylcytosine-specific restriction endonuclease McrBC regulatory subunit McrC